MIRGAFLTKKDLMTEDELIERGVRAQAVLQDPMIQQAINDLIEAIKNEILVTKPEETDKRERFYYAYQGVADVIGLLNQMVGVRVQIEQQRNADEDNK